MMELSPSYKRRVLQIAIGFCLALLPGLKAAAQSWYQDAQAAAKAQHWEKAIALGEANLHNGLADTLRATLLHDIGLWYSYLNELKISNQYYEKALLLEEKMQPLRLDKLALIYNNIAYNSSYLHEYSKVIELYKKAHDIWYQNNYGNISNNITALCNLITELIDLGLKRDAEIYFTRLEAYVSDILRGSLSRDFQQMEARERTNRLMFVQLTRVRFYSGMSQMKELEEAMVHFETLIRMPYFPDDRAMYLEALDVAGFSERFVGRFQSALQWYRKISQLAHNDFYRMKGAANQAVAHYYAGNYPDALIFNQRALTFFPENAQNASADGLWSMQAEIKAGNRNSIVAIQILESVFSRQLKRKVVGLDFQSLTINDFENFVSPGQISVLILAGNTFLKVYALDEKHKENLLQAHHFYKLAAELFSRFYSREGFTDALEAVRNRINEKLLETGTMLQLSQQEWLDILSRIENNASRHTWKKLLWSHATSLDIPAEWLQERQRLMAESQIISSDNEGDGFKRKKRLLAKIDSLHRLIQAKAPRFLAFDTAVVHMAQIRSQLPEGCLLLRFYVAEKQVYGLALTKQEIWVKKLGAADALCSAALQWSQWVRNPAQSLSDANQRLYQVLLAPFEGLLTQQKSLMVLPEAQFGLLSFEALLQQSAAYPSLKVLPVYYAYDVKIQELQQQFAPAARKAVAFAPTYPTYRDGESTAERGDVFYHLPNARNEAAYVARLLGGSLFEGGASTRQNFLAAIGKYGVYHLAMHAYMDTLQYDRSCLMFSNDQPLYFHELYQKPFSAELVVLSACNTGVGVLEAGEGAMGLSRALAFSGVQACIYALWDVPDKETSEIVGFFYEALKKGKAKQDALANAKAQFLAKYPEKSHPYYWAGLVLNGNPAPISGASNVAIWFVLGLGAFGLLVFIFIFYKKSKRIHN